MVNEARTGRGVSGRLPGGAQGRGGFGQAEREETVDRTTWTDVWRQKWDKEKTDQTKGLGVFEGPEKTQRPPGQPLGQSPNHRRACPGNS